MEQFTNHSKNYYSKINILHLNWHISIFWYDLNNDT